MHFFENLVTWDVKNQASYMAIDAKILGTWNNCIDFI
jgi:hypothetical protein